MEQFKVGDRVRRIKQEAGILEVWNENLQGVKVGEETEVVGVPGDEEYNRMNFSRGEKGMTVKPIHVYDRNIGGEDWYWVLQSDFELVES